MAPEAVQPLRINKSPSKMASPASRPLSEISPMGIRRNSPSFNQATGKPALAAGDSSPFDASPENASPRNFWKTRDNHSPARRDSEVVSLRNAQSSPGRRTSLEKLKNASRVTNSSMFAREHEMDYDPASSPTIERPLAYNRPLSVQMQGNAWVGSGLDAARSFRPHHKRTESNADIPQLSSTFQSPDETFSSPKFNLSPQKSSLSSNHRFEPNATDIDDPESEAGTRANTPRTLRQAKSVTFDNAPPQVNEYEMITPDPSSVASGSREGSYESDNFDVDDDANRASSSDREDSFDESLEDTEKTPVVLPEDWRFMQPDSANTDLAYTFEDPFAVRQALSSSSTRYRPTPERETQVTRCSSGNSNGENRPLPPLPPSQPSSPRRDSPSRITDLRSSPPRPASVSKAEILGMRSSPMPLDERLRLLSIENERLDRPQQDRREAEVGESDRDSAATSRSGSDQHKNRPQPQSTQVDFKPPPRVSRESILRNMNSKHLQEFQFDNASPVAPPSIDLDQIDVANLDPDEPIPSREIPSHYNLADDNAATKFEGSDHGSLVDMYASQESVDQRLSPSPVDENGIDSSVIHYDIPDSDVSDVDDEFVSMVEYSAISSDSQTHPSEEDLATPKPEGKSLAGISIDNSRISLPEFESVFSTNDFDFGLESFLSPSPNEEDTKSRLSTQAIDRLSLSTAQLLTTSDSKSRSVTPVPTKTSASEPLQTLSNSSEPTVAETAPGDGGWSESATPQSVIHNPFEHEGENDESVLNPSESVPEPVATIKASGTKLKTRMSATPADLQMMSATRRQISGEHVSPVLENDSTQAGPDDVSVSDTGEFLDDMSPSRAESLRMKIDMPLLSPNSTDMAISEEFDRLLEAKKKGYLMRQNTKVVVASTRSASGEKGASYTSGNSSIAEDGSISENKQANPDQLADSSPRKASTTWTTEPWNGRIRRQSTRRSNIVPGMRLQAAAVPVVQGQEGAMMESLESVSEDQDDEVDESGERGRLFVKVVGLKELDLPLPKNEKSFFQMTLDNGLHCVTTPWSELGTTCPIGQEFELVVFEDLEFQLTFQTKIERPSSAVSNASSFTPSIDQKKTSAFSRMFTSPKKRRERENREMQASHQRQQELEVQRANREPTAWDLQNELVGPDGSFARAYVCLSNHEQKAYGRPYVVDIPCWNEWAVEEQSIASTRSKSGGVQRKPPYPIAKMEIQLLYIPRPRGTTEEEMPKSMSSAVRQMKDAEATATRQFQGHLSQQGGDCPYWRRRFFKLHGSKLTAYHDMTRQPRATISLAKAVKLIDDKSSLTKPDPSSPRKGKSRRKSAFAEEEEGYMFVEEGFRIRFANGEVIDFYADNSEDKEKWMEVLSQAVGKETPGEQRKTWMSMVLAKEAAAAVATTKSSTKSSVSTKNPTSNQEQVPVRGTSKNTPVSPQKAMTTSAPSKSSTTAANTGAKEARPSSKSAAGSAPARIPVSPTKSTASPTKASFSPLKQSQSALKQKAASPVKEQKSPSKRNSAVAAPSPSPRKLGKEIPGKRQGVRSMIF